MKVRILSLVIGLIALSSFAFAQEEMMGNVEEPIAAGTEEIIDTTLIQNKFCPISGDAIGEMGEPKIVEYEGKKYKLCCPMCEKDFMADPAAAVKKIEAMMAEAEEVTDEGTGMMEEGMEMKDEGMGMAPEGAQMMPEDGSAVQK